jgi:hypothetical protein
MFSVEYQITRFQLKDRNHNALMKEINTHVMERQWNTRVPKHFTTQAYSLYRARPRGIKYNKRKVKYGTRGTAPNVFTGTLLASLRHKITATQYGSKLLMRCKLAEKLSDAEWNAMTPLQKEKYIRKKSRRLAAWQKEEIAKVSKGELTEERKRMSREYVRGATGKYRRLRKRKIK